MRFHLVDRILDVQPNKSLRAVKHLTAGEEYLADHFPTFPVMPGVMMLHALVESGSWLIRLSQDYAYSILVLREAKNVKYGTFLAPGRTMSISVELTKADGATFTFKGRGELEDGQSTVAAQFSLEGYNLRDRRPEWAARDQRLIQTLRTHCDWLMAGS